MSEQSDTGRRPRTPRNTLSADLILDTALRLLDERGLDAFSMRALAEELGVGTMALYTYFRSKEELFCAARDRVFGRYAPPPRTGGPWHRQLREACLGLYQLFTGRPSVLQLLAEQHRAERPAEQGPAVGAVATMEHMLGLLRGAGIGREEAARAQTALVQYTVGAALRAGRTRCTDAEQRRRFQARLESLSAEDFPLIVDLAPELAAAQESTTQYAFGLDLILAGLRTAGSWEAAGRDDGAPPAQSD
ncbi:TetR/AcrR family transcriptional regulator [Streptacidiphilus griseoplanus]|uniref:TetR/AcrR family transcriptional regulator n=1 Tax=Peterkaempfera griseoplana TaxID=66896 RepID=UPI0006E2A591|nr:TetR/AcrR family transcriptional regulator [Peterkaempfera griseoplana]